MADAPKKFKDALGREWSVDLSLPGLDEIAEHAGFELDSIIPQVDATKSEAHLPWTMFLADQLKIFDVFYALVKPQADAKKLSKKDVRKGFSTDPATDAMCAATIQAIIDFFHRRNPLRAQMLRESATKSNKLLTVAAARMAETMSKLDFEKLVAEVPELSAAEVMAAVHEQSKKNAGDSPATSASIPSPVGTP